MYWQFVLFTATFEQNIAMHVLLRVLLPCISTLAATIHGQGQVSAFEGDWMALKGTIESYPITVFLHRTGEHIAGHYWYDRTGEPILFMGTLANQSLRLQTTPRSEKEKQEEFLLKSDGSGWTGTWKQQGMARTLSVRLSVPEQMPAVQTWHWEDSLAALTLKPSPMARYSATWIWPTGASMKEDFIRRKILSCFAPPVTHQKDPSTHAKAACTEYFNKYTSQVTSTPAAEIREIPHAYNWSRDERIFISNYFGNILCLDHYQYEYTGGAHGLGYSTYKVLDLSQRKVLLLEDILSDAGIQALPGLLEKHFRRTWGVHPSKTLEQAGLLVDRIASDRYNFFLTHRAIVFAFAPYEIAAYVYGEIRIPLPYTDLKPYLLPTFTQTLRQWP